MVSISLVSLCCPGDLAINNDQAEGRSTQEGGKEQLVAGPLGTRFSGDSESDPKVGPKLGYLYSPPSLAISGRISFIMAVSGIWGHDW